MKKVFRIEKPKEKKSSAILPWFIFLFVILAFGTFFYWKKHQENAPLPSLTYEVLNFSGKVEILDETDDANWKPISRGMLLGPMVRIHTDKNGEVDLKASNQLKLRLKPESSLEGHQSGNRYGLKLNYGQLYLANEKKSPLEEAFTLFNQSTAIQVKQASFYLTQKNNSSESWMGVMRGSVEVIQKSLFQEKRLPLASLQRIAINKGVMDKPSVVSRKDWDQMKEVYELTQMTAAMEARQLDLSKKAGSLFDYVFDHGTFYTPKIGYCGREFILDEETGEVYLDAEYDVFPKGSFVGIYIKIRDLDLKDFEGFEFEAKKASDEEAPSSFQIEIKSKGQTIRRFAPTSFHATWQKQRFEFQATKSAPVSEMTLLFSHDRVGASKKGSLWLRNFRLIAKTPALSEKAALPETTGIKQALDLRKRLDFSELHEYLDESSAPLSKPDNSNTNTKQE